MKTTEARGVRRERERHTAEEGRMEENDERSVGTKQKKKYGGKSRRNSHVQRDENS